MWLKPPESALTLPMIYRLKIAHRTRRRLDLMSYNSGFIYRLIDDSARNCTKQPSTRFTWSVNSANAWWISGYFSLIWKLNTLFFVLPKKETAVIDFQCTGHFVWNSLRSIILAFRAYKVCRVLTAINSTTVHIPLIVHQKCHITWLLWDDF